MGTFFITLFFSYVNKYFHNALWDFLLCLSRYTNRKMLPCYFRSSIIFYLNFINKFCYLKLMNIWYDCWCNKLIKMKVIMLFLFYLFNLQWNDAVSTKHDRKLTVQILFFYQRFPSGKSLNWILRISLVSKAELWVLLIFYIDTYLVIFRGFRSLLFWSFDRFHLSQLKCIVNEK